MPLNMSDPSQLGYALQTYAGQNAGDPNFKGIVGSPEQDPAFQSFLQTLSPQQYMSALGQQGGRPFADKPIVQSFGRDLIDFTTQLAGPAVLGYGAAAGVGAGLGAGGAVAPVASGAFDTAAFEGIGGAGALGGGAAFDAAGFEGLTAADAGLGASTATAAAPWWSSPQAALKALGLGGTGAATGAAGGASGMASWLSPLMSVGSGIYGILQSEQMKKLAQQAISGSSPWAASGGTANAGTELTRTINGDILNDPGFQLAQQAAARATSTQPGGASTQAAANAALQYQNQRIQALSGPAGVGFNPAAGFQTAISGFGGGNVLASSSLGSIGFGINQATGGSNSMPPWLQQYLIQNGFRMGAA